MGTVINLVAYREGVRISEVTVEDISEVIREPGTFIWLGLYEPDNTMLEKIKEEFALHELAIEDAHNAHQRPKIEVYGDSLFIVLKTVHEENGNTVFGETHLFVGTNFLVSVRHGASASYKYVRERCEKNPKMLGKGPGFVLYSLLDFVVDNYKPIVLQFEKKFDLLEGDIFKGQFDKLVIERIYDLKLELLELRNAVLPIRDISIELMRFHEELIPKELRPFFRDIQDHVARLIESLDNMREMLTTAMQVNLALVGVAQNEVVKKLAGWGAILAIPTVIFSLYGMNFEFMPELKWSFGYPFSLAVTFLGCAILYRKLRKSGWV
ncbi:MAG: magnesium/cobalt transporter CorA [Bdellovibrionaceae bacterium]|nr:magnesium/cobalt transporter CorA [Pseudobdellovibrionaceae bacterium]